MFGISLASNILLVSAIISLIGWIITVYHYSTFCPECGGDVYSTGVFNTYGVNYKCKECGHYKCKECGHEFGIIYDTTPSGETI